MERLFKTPVRDLQVDFMKVSKQMPKDRPSRHEPVTTLWFVNVLYPLSFVLIEAVKEWA